jgi:hypothetical protein
MLRVQTQLVLFLVTVTLVFRAAGSLVLMSTNVASFPITAIMLVLAPTRTGRSHAHVISDSRAAVSHVATTMSVRSKHIHVISMPYAATPLGLLHACVTLVSPVVACSAQVWTNVALLPTIVMVWLLVLMALDHLRVFATRATLVVASHAAILMNAVWV